MTSDSVAGCVKGGWRPIETERLIGLDVCQYLIENNDTFP